MLCLWANDKKKEDGDTWWQFSDCVEEFNENRKSMILASSTKLLDESMWTFAPQTTKT
jgi:hypothetical protein